MGIQKAWYFCCLQMSFFFFLFLYPMSLKSMIPRFVYFLTLLFFFNIALMYWYFFLHGFSTFSIFQVFPFQPKSQYPDALKKMLPLKWKQQKKLQQKNFLFFQEYEKNFGVDIHRPSRVVLLLNKSRWSSATQSDELTM